MNLLGKIRGWLDELWLSKLKQKIYKILLHTSLYSEFTKQQLLYMHHNHYSDTAILYLHQLYGRDHAAIMVMQPDPKTPDAKELKWMEEYGQIFAAQYNCSYLETLNRHRAALLIEMYENELTPQQAFDQHQQGRMF